jgi:hypothetical protein
MSDLSLLSGEERKSHFSAVTSVDDRCCRKSRKSKDAENLANGEFWITPPLQCSVVLIRRSVVVFLRHDVVPQSRRTKRISGFRKFRLVPLKAFFDSIDP